MHNFFYECKIVHPNTSFSCPGMLHLYSIDSSLSVSCFFHCKAHWHEWCDEVPNDFNETVIKFDHTSMSTILHC